MSGYTELEMSRRFAGSPPDAFLQKPFALDQLLRIVAAQRDQLDRLIVQLDRLGKPLAELTRTHGADIDAQVKDLHKIVPQLYAARDRLSQAVGKLPSFTKLFARAIPGDYIQLDIQVQTPGLPLTGSSTSDVLWGATK